MLSSAKARAARTSLMRASRTYSVAMSFQWPGDRKSTRLNSSHSQISYAVFCLKKQSCRPERRGGCGRIGCAGNVAHEHSPHPAPQYDNITLALSLYVSLRQVQNSLAAQERAAA